MHGAARFVWLVALAVSLGACEREERDFHVDPASAGASPATQLSELKPGTTRPATTSTATTTTTAPASTEIIPIGTSADANRFTPLPPPQDYSRNAYALSEGKRLYSYFNCVGCHAHGGGGMGPALMDSAWLYGSSPEEVHTTISRGRPNGMPAFGERLPSYQVWQLAHYVRSMSGLVRRDAAPGRDDRLKHRPPENTIEPATPREAKP